MVEQTNKAITAAMEPCPFCKGAVRLTPTGLVHHEPDPGCLIEAGSWSVSGWNTRTNTRPLPDEEAVDQAWRCERPGCERITWATGKPDRCVHCRGSWFTPARGADDAAAIELLARLEEIDGNRAGAFTLRNAGAVGTVFEQKLDAVLAAMPAPVSGDVERLMFSELVKRGVDQDTADQAAQAVAAKAIGEQP